MRVALDGLPYFLHKGDIGEYTRGLINDITPLEGDRIHLIKDKEILTREIGLSKLKISNLYINRINSDYKAISDFIFNTKSEIYHCTNNGFSLQREYKYNCNVITTIHTFIPSSYEIFYNERYLEKYFNSLQIWDRYSDVLICPSTYIEDQLYFNLGISKDKMVHIPPRVNKIFAKTNSYVSSVYIRSKFNFSGDFILFCGDIHKRKRLEEFLEIYKRLSYSMPNLYFVILCNVDGTNFQYYKELKSLVDDFALDNRVIFITSYTLTDKLHFYNLSKVVIDFSYYEGLNISLMEAKAVGANIICSDIQTYREILDDYPLYMNLNLPFIEEILEDYLANPSVNSYEEQDRNKEANLYDLYKSILG